MATRSVPQYKFAFNTKIRGIAFDAFRANGISFASMVGCLAMNKEPSRLGPVMSVISTLGSLLLIVLGIVFAIDHVLAAAAYGLPLSGGPDNSWITSAAWRDLTFGCLALTFAILRDRRAMGLSVLFGALIPIGDAIIVYRYSPAPLTYLPLHIGGALGCIAFAIFLLYPQGRTLE